MRKKLIAANWKMYKTPEQAQAFFDAFLPQVFEHTRDEIAVCPPFLCLSTAVQAAAGTHIILGHSERRQYFADTDDTVNLKLKAALAAGLVPIVCVGEVIQEREAGLTA